MGVAALGLGSAVGLTIGSLYQSNEARKDTRRAQRANQRIEARKLQKQKQEALRASQRERAKITANSVSQGTQEASASQGGIASIQTQTTNNISFIEQINQAQLQVQRRLEKAAQHQANAQAMSQVASLASMAVGMPGMGGPPAPNTPAPVVTSQGKPAGTSFIGIV